jgi:hypothetical protein
MPFSRSALVVSRLVYYVLILVVQPHVALQCIQIQLFLSTIF